VIRYVCALSLCACASAPEQDEHSVERELADLLERTSALQSIHAVYDVELAAEDVETGNAELVYRRPDVLQLRMTAGADSAECWLRGEAFYWRTTLGGRDGAWHRAELGSGSPASLLLDAEFPDEERCRTVRLGLTIADDASKEEAQIQVEGGFELRRASPLGWLASMKRHASDVSIEGGSFVWSGRYFRAAVSRASGMLESLTLQRHEGASELRLRECTFDEAIEPSLLELPADAASAGVDRENSEHMHSFFRLWLLRGDAFKTVQHDVDSHRRVWDESTRANLRTVLAALHEEEIGERYGDWLADQGRYIDELGAWADDARSRDGSSTGLTSIEQKVSERRAKLSEDLETVRKDFIESVPPAQFEKLALGAEFSALELEVIAAVWNERVRDPVLADFDEELSAAAEH